MRFKIQAPSGSYVLTLAEDSTVSTLLSDIRSKASITGDIDVRCGYPPQPLHLSDYPPSMPLRELPVKLEGEQLIVFSCGASSSLKGTGIGVIKNAVPKEEKKTEEATTGLYEPSNNRSGGSEVPFSFTTGATKASQKPISLSRAVPEVNKDDPPDVRLSSGRGTVVLRVMEDDNSCLFRALSYVMTRNVMSVDELRQLVAGSIQKNRDKYSRLVLEQEPDAYCEWIKMESSWGGGIELGILAEFFDTEICTIDVATGNLMRFSEGMPRRVIVVYSGIHYDALALCPAGSSIHDNEQDELVFDNDDLEIVAAAKELCLKLKEKHYFTDTNSFAITCNVCQETMKGQRAAVAHATATGHYSFGEA